MPDKTVFVKGCWKINGARIIEMGICN